MLCASVLGCATAAPESSLVPDDAAVVADGLIPLESGFLSDYSNLVASEQFATVKFYRDQIAEGGYSKLFVHPVQVWRGADKRLEDVPENDLQYLADELYDALEVRLGKSFELVEETGPGVLDIHLAFTLVTHAESAIDFFSTTVPVEDLAPRTGKLNAATKLFLHDCALEVEFTEGIPEVEGGRRGKSARAVRAALFDTRRGDQSPKGSVETWADVHAVFEKWAASLDERFEALRDGTFQPKFTAPE